MRKYAHIRNTNKGTYTIAFDMKHNGVDFAIARCNPKDQFNRFLGREIASNRLKANQGEHISFEEIGSDRYKAITDHIVSIMDRRLPDKDWTPYR